VLESRSQSPVWLLGTAVAPVIDRDQKWLAFIWAVNHASVEASLGRINIKSPVQRFVRAFSRARVNDYGWQGRRRDRDAWRRDHGSGGGGVASLACGWAHLRFVSWSKEKSPSAILVRVA